MKLIWLLVTVLLVNACTFNDEPTLTNEQYMHAIDSLRTERVLTTKFASKGSGFYEKHSVFNFYGDSVIVANIGGATTRFSVFKKDGDTYGAATIPTWDQSALVQVYPITIKKNGFNPSSIQIGGYTFTNTPTVFVPTNVKYYIVEKGDSPLSLSKRFNMSVNKFPKNLKVGDKIAVE